ncbi:tachylectin-related carbohydrate-binding protein [Lentzea flaviverrucosa]|uniref:tachylectin-related carbohydrate-binding protein n=1 Tax=Lentzea flaviverrucosa TaxID=200379 RepID=UPI00147685C7|nr:tachylectin-related carbohydrate-binding protein [Lentzea flaviverrucosa]
MRRSSLGAAVASVLGVSLIVAPGATVASAAATLSCNTAATVIGVNQQGSVFTYPHEEPENGTFVWGAKQSIPSSGWTGGRTLAGPDGVIYSMVAGSGDLRRFRLDYTTAPASWVTQPGGGQFRQVGSGWSRYTEAVHRNKVTIDEKGRLYEINADGNLKVFVWQGGDDGMWTAETGGGKVLATGFGQYDLITASGDGVLYARKPDGSLFRYRYDAAADRFVEAAPRQVGAGWQMFNRIFSPGGDILYGTWPGQDGTGQLLWYRYHEDTGTWAPGDPATGLGKVVGTGWYSEFDVMADTNACRLLGYPTTPRPSVPGNFTSPVAILQGQDNLPNYFFVHNNGALIHGRQRSSSDLQTVDHTPLPGHDKYTGTPGAAMQANNLFEVQAHSFDDAETRGKTQAAVNGAFGPGLTQHRGHLAGDSVLVKGSDGPLSSFGVSSDGKLWSRKQIAANGVFPAWNQVAGATGLTTDITVVANGTSFAVVARHTDNSFRVARLTNGVLGSWTHLGGTNGVGKAAVVVDDDNRLRILIRKSDNKIYIQQESVSGFPGSWSVIDGLVAASAPAAVWTDNDTVEVVVRGTGTQAYHTGQNAPGSPFRAWQELVGEKPYEIASDVSMTMWTDGTWRTAFRDPMGELVVFRGLYGQVSPSATAQRSAAAAGPAYQGGKVKRLR